MPPFPGNWCCDPKVVFMFVVQTALVWMSCQIHLYTTTPIIWNVLAVLAALVWFRLLALVVVRSSINKCIQICLELIFQREHDNINMVVVGFSWGAAVRLGLISFLSCECLRLRMQQKVLNSYVFELFRVGFGGDACQRNNRW